MNTVVMLTHSGDSFVTDRVGAALEARGVRAVRVNSDEYPASLDLAVSIDVTGKSEVRLGGVDPDALRAVWLRRCWGPAAPEGVPPELAASFKRELSAHWTAAFDSLRGVRMVNRPDAEARVEGHKLRQLAAARAAGLAVPDTLLTNDPDAARAFVERHSGDVVVKLLTAMSTSMAGDGPRVHTRRLGPEDIEALDGLREGPMLMQPRVRAQHELRVAWVEGRVFAGRVEAGDDPDWRRGARGGWAVGELGDDTVEALGRLMRGLGLSYGAVDLMVPREGPPIFLEVNPAGEWGMLEHALGLPVSEAIADALLMERS